MIDGGNARIISTSSNQTIVCIYINYHTFGSGRSSPFLRLCSNKWITISVSFTLLSNFQTRVIVSEVPSKTVIARFTAKHAVCHQQKEDCRLHRSSNGKKGRHTHAPADAAIVAMELLLVNLHKQPASSHLFTSRVGRSGK